MILAKYLNGNVLKQTLAFWLSRMMVEMQKCYDVLVKESNEIHAEVLLERAVKFDPASTRGLNQMGHGFASK